MKGELKWAIEGVPLTLEEYQTKAGEPQCRVKLPYMGGMVECVVHGDDRQKLANLSTLRGKIVDASGIQIVSIRQFGRETATNVEFTLESIAASKS